MGSEQQVRTFLCRSDSPVQRPPLSCMNSRLFRSHLLIGFFATTVVLIYLPLSTFKIQNKNLRKLCYSWLLGYVNAELPWSWLRMRVKLRADGYFQSPWLGSQQIPCSRREWYTAACRSSSCSRLSFHEEHAVKTVQDPVCSRCSPFYWWIIET